MRVGFFVLVGALLLLPAASEAILGAAAQTLPAAGESDLVVPPDLRGTPSARPADPSPAPRHRASAGPGAAAPRAGGGGDAARNAKADLGHPVDVGVVMRGGSGTPRLISPLGSTQAVRESGSAFGAGVRIGF